MISEGVEVQSVILCSLRIITKAEMDYIDIHISHTKLRTVHIFLCEELRIGSPLQYSGLENSMDCEVQRVTKSQTRLSDFHFTFTLVYKTYTGFPWWSSG